MQHVPLLLLSLLLRLRASAGERGHAGRGMFCTRCECYSIPSCLNWVPGAGVWGVTALRVRFVPAVGELTHSTKQNTALAACSLLHRINNMVNTCLQGGRDPPSLS